MLKLVVVFGCPRVEAQRVLPKVKTPKMVGDLISGLEGYKAWIHTFGATLAMVLVSDGLSNGKLSLW
mgnify:CR=1